MIRIWAQSVIAVLVLAAGFSDVAHARPAADVTDAPPADESTLQRSNARALSSLDDTASETESQDSDAATPLKPGSAAESGGDGTTCLIGGLIGLGVVVGIVVATVMAFAGIFVLTIVGANFVEGAICTPLCAAACGALGIFSLFGSVCDSVTSDLCSAASPDCGGFSGAIGGLGPSSLASPPPFKLQVSGSSGMAY